MNTEGMVSERKKPRGRPRLPKGAGKRYALNMRATKELFDKLERAGKQSGRSRMQEAEYRVEQSFAREAHFHEMFGGPRIFKFALLLAQIVRLVEDRYGKPIEKDALTFAAAKQAIDGVLEALGPKPAGADFEGAGLLDARPGPLSPYVQALADGHEISQFVLARLQQLGSEGPKR